MSYPFPLCLLARRQLAGVLHSSKSVRKIYYTNDALNASNLSSLGNVGDLPWRGRSDPAQSVPGWLLQCPQLTGERGMSDVLAHMLQGMLNVIPDGQRELAALGMHARTR